MWGKKKSPWLLLPVKSHSDAMGYTQGLSGLLAHSLSSSLHLCVAKFLSSWTGLPLGLPGSSLAFFNLFVHPAAQVFPNPAHPLGLTKLKSHLTNNFTSHFQDHWLFTLRFLGLLADHPPPKLWALFILYL